MKLAAIRALPLVKLCLFLHCLSLRFTLRITLSQQKSAPLSWSLSAQFLSHKALRELVCYFSFLREEEVARFQEVISDPQYRANPLLAISKHLSERLRQGEAGEPL